VIVRGPSLVLSARVAAAIEPAVAEAEARARRDGIPLDPDVADALAELHDLAAWWRASVASAEPRPPAETPTRSLPMTVADAAARLDVSPSRVRQRLRAGELPGERVGGRWHVDRAALEGKTDRS
jgi:excisionase family DNA binding protein